MKRILVFTDRRDAGELLAHHHDDDGEELPPQAWEAEQFPCIQLLLGFLKKVLLAHVFQLGLHVLLASQLYQDLADR